VVNVEKRAAFEERFAGDFIANAGEPVPFTDRM
jgi:hypothetical protein